MSAPLPEPRIQTLVADAVHHAVSRLFDPSILHIGPINTIGCFLLQHFFQREYRPVCGSVQVHAAGQTFGLRANPNELDAHEYYLWIEAQNPDGTTEFVDFGARYWREWAQGMGVLWIGTPPPAVVWSPKADVPPTLAEYAADPTITAYIQNEIGRAIATRQPDQLVETWEQAINDAIDCLASSEEGLEFLVQAGIAEPLED